MKSQDNKKLQESIQKALLGKLNESFWDSDEFPYNLDDYPEYTPEAVGAKQLLRQLLKRRGFKTYYIDEDKYKFDEPWLFVERDGIEDSFDIYEGSKGYLYLLAGIVGSEDRDDNELEKIGYENQDKMQLGYTKEFNTIEDLDRICIAIDKHDYESAVVDFVKKLDNDFKVAETIKNSGKKIDNKDITDDDIRKAIRDDLEEHGGLFTDDSKYDVIEALTGIEDIDEQPEGLWERIDKIYETEFNKEESKKVESKDSETEKDEWWSKNFQRAIDYVNNETPKKVIKLFGDGDNGAKEFYNESTSKAIAVELMNYLGTKKFDEIITEFENKGNKKVTESKDDLKLSDSDIEYLKKIGHTEEDIPQIEDALNNTIYTLGNAGKSSDGNIEIPDEQDDVEITAQEAREILGDEKFLSGLSRSAFHYTSGRWNNDDTKYVSFDSSKIFEENKELKTEDSISLEFTDYIVEGEAVLNLWGGGQGRIVMDSYHIDEVTPEEICSNANDGQFGCESIEGIEGTIYKNYSGHAVYYKDFEYMGEDFIKYNGSNSKRGIETENKDIKTEKVKYKIPGYNGTYTDYEISIKLKDGSVVEEILPVWDEAEPETYIKDTYTGMVGMEDSEILDFKPVNENKKIKTEAYNYNWRDDIEEVEDTEENDELVYAFAENLIETDPDYADYDDPWQIISNIISIWKIPKKSRLYDYLLKWYGSESNMKNNIRSFYETNDAIYFETGCGYSIFDADLLGGNADGTTADEFSRFVANGGKKEEGLDDKSDVAERSRKLKLMDIACRSINDEDIIDIWLYDGCPDESTQEDYDEIAEDIDEYNRMEALFKGLMKHAVADGLYDCPEEAYEFAKQYQPDLKNLK